jgi:hypothetical protein
MVLWLSYQADCGGNHALAFCIDYAALIPSSVLKEDTIDAINAAKGPESMLTDGTIFVKLLLVKFSFGQQIFMESFIFYI